MCGWPFKAGISACFLLSVTVKGKGVCWAVVPEAQVVGSHLAASFLLAQLWSRIPWQECRSMHGWTLSDRGLVSHPDALSNPDYLPNALLLNIIVGSLLHPLRLNVNTKPWGALKPYPNHSIGKLLGTVPIDSLHWWAQCTLRAQKWILMSHLPASVSKLFFIY